MFTSVLDRCLPCQGRIRPSTPKLTVSASTCDQISAKPHLARSRTELGAKFGSSGPGPGPGRLCLRSATSPVGSFLNISRTRRASPFSPLGRPFRGKRALRNYAILSNTVGMGHGMSIRDVGGFFFCARRGRALICGDSSAGLDGIVCLSVCGKHIYVNV